MLILQSYYWHTCCSLIHEYFYQEDKMNPIKATIAIFFILFAISAYPKNPNTFNEFNLSEYVTGIWKLKTINQPGHCPNLETYFEINKNEKNRTVKDSQELITKKISEVKIKGEYFIEKKLAFTFYTYLLADRSIVSYNGNGQYRNCNGELEISKTKLKDSIWSFSFIPNMDSIHLCENVKIKVKSTGNQITSYNANEKFLKGIIETEQINIIDARAEIAGIEVIMDGKINFELGTAKGEFNSTSCSGFFEGRIIEENNAKELVFLNNSSLQLQI